MNEIVKDSSESKSRFRNFKIVPSPFRRPPAWKSLWLGEERVRVRVNSSPLRLPLPPAPSRKGRGIYLENNFLSLF
jgi:hypothetical protein